MSFPPDAISEPDAISTLYALESNFPSSDKSSKVKSVEKPGVGVPSVLMTFKTIPPE